jgi:lysyl-tRNA synthetase class 2
MVEFYQAYSNYHDLMDLTEELVKYVANEVNGSLLTNFNGVEIDLGKWTKLSMREAIIKFWPDKLAGVPVMDDFADAGRFRSLIKLANAETYRLNQLGDLDIVFTGMGLQNILWEMDKGAPLGKTIAELFEQVAEHHLQQPTIIYDFPLAVSPLSKVKPDEPDWVERFEFYIGGFEVGNAFSELNDPDDQRARFEAQLEERKRGDEEAMAEVDTDYVRALGYGLPPTAGEGIGIDRLTMILTGSKSIRDVILFPLLRPHAKAAE